MATHGVSGVIPDRFTRPGVLTAVAVFDVLVGLLYLVAGLGLAIASGGEMTPVAIGLLVAGIGLVQLAAAVGIWMLAPWGRMLQLAISVLGLLGFPCGTLLYGVVLYYLTRPGIAVLFTGRRPAELAPHEWDEVNRGGGNSGLVLIAVAALALLMIPIVGIMAAIAIPSLLRARVSANEAATIGNLRTVISAEEAYASANGGHYDTLACLNEPARCIPGYPAVGPRFLDALAPEAKGYRFTFHPGPPPEQLDPRVSSPSSLSSYVYVAVPLKANQTGVRSFCADASGVVCSQHPGVPEPENGACPASCSPLQ